MWKIHEKRDLTTNFTDFSDSSRKQIFSEFSYFYHEIVCCVYSLELPYQGDSNEYTQHTTIV